ncbi:MAG: glycosyltransferase [Clostridia bacterium]|nr:glycosyltransferase [Clostridia bacterium]
MKKVLMVAGQMNVGGLENMVMNFVRYSDRKNIHFDFMLNYEGEQFYFDEIRSFGSNIYVMPRLKPKNMIKYPLALIKFFRQHRGEYDVLHGNLTSVGVFYLPIAKIVGKVKKCAVHAHYTNTEKNHYEKLERLMLFPLRFLADYYFACSDMAGAFCYGKNILKKDNYKLIHNGVDCDKFDYNPRLRAEVRRELDIGEEFVLLNVGRLMEQKNQRLLLNIAAELKKRGMAVKVLIAGIGDLREELEDIIRQKELADCAVLLGLRNDVDRLMQAADAFILTSIFEGLPVAGIEAQAAGLPCIMADTITTELDITGNTCFVPLHDMDAWVGAVLKAMKHERKSTADIIKGKGYDIKTEAGWISDFYKGHGD